MCFLKEDNMKKGLKMLAASLAAVTAMTFASVGASAYKTKTVDGIKYRYSDDWKQNLGKYNGWTTAKSGAKYYYKDGVKLKNSWLKVKGKRTYYFDSKGKMVTGEYSDGAKTYLFGSDGKLIYGIEAKGRKTSQTGMSFTLNGIALGNENIEVWTGEEYRIEYKTNTGVWAQRSLVTNNYGWDDVGVLICYENVLVQRTEDLNWEWLYGKLPAGEYRLCKDYYVRLDPKSSPIKKKLYVPFTVKVYDTAEEAWGIEMNASDVTTDGLTVYIMQNSDNVGEVSFDGSYILEVREKTGEWSEVDKGARKKAVFPDLNVTFRNYSSAANKDVEVNSSHDNIEFYTGELPIGNYRIKRLINGNCNGMKGSLYATARFDITADTPNSWGLSFGSENDASETGITLYAGVTSAPTAKIFGDIWTGEAYDIERLTADGDWEALEPVTEDGELYWNEIGIIIPENDTRILKTDWSNTYGKLPKGTYRISKTFYSYNNALQTGPAVSKTVYCRFTIDEGSVNIGDYTVDVSVTKTLTNSLTMWLTRSGKYAGTVYWDYGFDLFKKNSKGKFKLYKDTSAINGSSSEFFTVDIPSGRTVKTTFSLSGLYPELTSGTYRIKLKLIDQTGHIKYAYGDFEIK